MSGNGIDYYVKMLGELSTMTATVVLDDAEMWNEAYRQKLAAGEPVWVAAEHACKVVNVRAAARSFAYTRLEMAPPETSSTSQVAVGDWVYHPYQKTDGAPQEERAPDGAKRMLAWLGSLPPDWQEVLADMAAQRKAKAGM